MSREDIISDAEIARVHGRANFGTMTARQVVDDGIGKVVVGYHCGHTQFTILREHGLITKPKAMSYDCNLTKKGKKYYRAVLAAAPPADGWQPIETAPRDGTLILCFYPDRHGHDRYSLRYWATGDWGVRAEGWSDQYRQLRKTDPTHWMPLPQPPNNERTG